MFTIKHVSVYTYIHIHIHICKYIHIHIDTHIHLYSHMHTCTCTYLHTQLIQLDTHIQTHKFKVTAVTFKETSTELQSRIHSTIYQLNPKHLACKNNMDQLSLNHYHTAIINTPPYCHRQLLIGGDT